MKRLYSTIGVLLALLASTKAAIRLKERFSWKAVDYEYPDEFTKQNDILTGAYIPENNLPVGIEVWKNKLFVSVPRWREGIPSTFNYVDMDKATTSSPKLIPYPSLKGNELGNCETGLSTVYRVKADKCGRLWVLDTGTYGIGNTTTNPCPYAINVFDLKTDTRIRRYVLRPEDINPNTFIANIAVDIGSSCEDTFAYLSDELGYGLIVYSWEQNKSWRFHHDYFQPDPLLGDFNIAGLNFQWGEEGIFGIALSPIKRDGYRTLFFSPIASNREFSVSTRILRDSSKVDNSYHDFQVLESRAPNGHLTAKVISDDGIMLFNLIDQNAIGCWNSLMPYKPKNHAIVDRDDVGLVFPSDIKIDANENVWVMSDRMPVFLEAELDFSDKNFRVYTAPLNELIKGTVCDLQKSTGDAILREDYTSLRQPQTFDFKPNLQAVAVPASFDGHGQSFFQSNFHNGYLGNAKFITSHGQQKDRAYSGGFYTNQPIGTFSSYPWHAKKLAYQVHERA